VQATPPKKREREIIDAAAEIFHRNGYADTSVQDVAESVGILKGSLYYYIDSKEDLLYRVLLEVHEDAQGILESILALPDVTPLERIAAYVRRHVEYNVHNVTKVAVYYHDFDLLSADRRDVIRKHRREYENFLENLIREAQAAGEVDETADPRALAYCMFGTMNWTYTWYRPNGRMSVAELCDTIAQFAVNGLRSQKPLRISARALPPSAARARSAAKGSAGAPARAANAKPAAKAKPAAPAATAKPTARAANAKPAARAANAKPAARAAKPAAAAAAAAPAKAKPAARAAKAKPAGTAAKPAARRRSA
jgi:AcrR family transcriptional regulator